MAADAGCPSVGMLNGRGPERLHSALGASVMSFRRQFAWLFVAAMLVQLGVYGFYLRFGTYGLDKPGYAHSPTPFGEIYAFLYLVPLAWFAANALGVGGGLRTIGLLFWLSPLVVALIYSLAFAVAVTLIRRRAECAP